MQHGHEGCASPADSVVGSPRWPAKARRAEEYQVQERLMMGIWSHSAGEAAGAQGMDASMPLLLNVHEEEACASQQPAQAERHMEDCDDMLASVLGHMSEVTDLDEMSSDVSVADLGWSGHGCCSPAVVSTTVPASRFCWARSLFFCSSSAFCLSDILAREARFRAACEESSRVPDWMEVTSRAPSGFLAAATAATHVCHVVAGDTR